jgi:cell filamentation protein
VTFYPFGDFATAGYLRNFEKEKDLEIVKRAENSSFTTGLDEAFELLAKSKQLTYEHVLQTHGILFGAVYPWAGQDRLVTTPKLSIRKGNVAYDHLATEVVKAPGLDGSAQDAELNEVLGNTDDPAVKAQYEAMLIKRKQT